MDMLSHLLADDPASPRLTVYNEADGTRMDFSAQTTENWASKIANFLREELDLDESSVILCDLPVSWHTAMIALGALAAGISVRFATDDTAADLAVDRAADRAAADTTTDSGADPVAASGADSGAEPAVFFTSAEKVAEYANHGDVVVVTNDPFGRGLEEMGEPVPEGAIDFGPTVRFYGDFYPGPTRPLADWDSFTRQVLSPLAAGGSAVVVAGMASTDRLAEIAENEKITARD